MVLYFSGTGNSRYAARKLAAELGDELIDAGTMIKEIRKAELYSERPWIFVSPTYAWQLPHIFADYIRAGSFSGIKTAYFVMTCGSEIGNAGAKIEQLCKEKGFEFQGVLQLPMPENYIAMYSAPTHDETKKIIADAEPLITKTAERIRNHRKIPERKTGFSDILRSGIVNQIFYKYFVRSDKFYVKETCISCSKCSKNCSLNNIEMKNGRPTWGNNCTHCMACICGCPVEAIEYGKHSIGLQRYQCPY